MMKFEITDRLIECLRKSIEAGYETELSEGYAAYGSCGTGRLNATNWSGERRKDCLELLDGKTPWSRLFVGAEGLRLPGVIDLTELADLRLSLLYRVMNFARPDKADLAEEDERILMDLQRDVRKIYKASPLERLAMEAE